MGPFAALIHEGYASAVSQSVKKIPRRSFPFCTFAELRSLTWYGKRWRPRCELSNPENLRRVWQFSTTIGTSLASFWLHRMLFSSPKNVQALSTTDSVKGRQPVAKTAHVAPEATWRATQVMRSTAVWDLCHEGTW